MAVAVAVAQAFMRTIRGRPADTPPSSSPPAPSSSPEPLPSADPDSPPPPLDPSSYDRPLTIAVAAIGLIAASHHTSLFCQSLTSTPRGTPSPLHTLRTALQSLKLTAQLSYKWLRRVEAVARLPFPDRPRLIDVDAVLVLLAEAAESVSDAGDLLADVVHAAAGAAVLVPDVLPAYAPALVDASERIDRVEHLLSKLLTILQISSLAEATSARTTIDAALPPLLSSNTPLARALASMPDHFSALSLAPAARLAAVRDRPPPGYSVPAPSATEALPDYSAATASDAPHPDGSVTIRPAGWWSVFAALTLADVCVLALLPLPLRAADLRYGECYTEAYARRVGPPLADVMEGPAKAKAAQLAAILGSRAEGDDGGGGGGGVTEEENFARRVGLQRENRTTRDGRPRLRPQPNLIIGGP